MTPLIVTFIWLTGLYKCVLIEAQHNLPLLAATLRTYQRAACDSEQLMLSCPRGTSISIELAQYGRAGDLGDHTLCHPLLQDNANTSSSSIFRTSSGAEVEIKPPEICAISGLQYTLLQSVVGACQKKRHCKFSGNSTVFNSGDPCYGIRKFIEIAYKCRPYEFRSKVACEDDSLVLMCNPYSRIAIYSASFGHIERDSVQCGHNNTEVSEPACLVAYATETVMQICHGRRRCTVAADAGTFGRPCKTNVRMYLKVVYTCLPRKVLKERYETAPESDEPQSDLEIGQDELYDEDQFYKESEAVPPKVQGAIPNAAAKPLDFNRDAEILSQQRPTSTFMTPLLNYNESTLEDGKNRIKNILMETSYEDTSISSTKTSFISEHETDNTRNSERNITEGNFIYRRRCQITDDWGPIGLNCTDYDMDLERVDVYGFMANWMQAYASIKQNQEELYLYLVISVAAGVLICLTLVIGRLTLLRENTCCPSGDSEVDDKNTEIALSRKNRKKKNSENIGTDLSSMQHNYEDELSDIDIDQHATNTPTAVCNYANKQDQAPAYMTCAAASPNCTYSILPPPTSATNLPSNAKPVLVPMGSHVGGLMMQRHGQVGSVNTLGSVLMSANRQSPSPPMPATSTNMYADGVSKSTISGTMAMAPRLLAPSPLSALTTAHQPHATSSNPSPYLSGSIILSGHHQHPHPHPHPHSNPNQNQHHQHAQLGTLRRLIPTNVSAMGMSNTPVDNHHHAAHINMTGIPSASQVYYDSTIPRNLVNRPVLLDSQQQSSYGMYG